MQNLNFNDITELSNAITSLKDNLNKHIKQLTFEGNQSVSKAYRNYLIDTLKKSPEQVIEDACAELHALVSMSKIYNDLEKYIKAKESYESSVESMCVLIKELTGEELVPLQIFESNKMDFKDASSRLAQNGITTNWLVIHGMATEKETIKMQQLKSVIGIKYKKIKNGVRIDSVEWGGEIVIPEFIDGLPVTKISDKAFYKRKDITSVILPQYLNDIGNEAFFESGIVSISIPNSVDKIGDRAFYNCRQIENILLPEGLKSIKYQTFGGCSALSMIKIPPNVVAIGDRAFERCRKLKKVQIPDSVVRIGCWAFDYKTTIFCNENTRASRYVIENSLRAHKPYEMYDKE